MRRAVALLLLVACASVACGTRAQGGERTGSDAALLQLRGQHPLNAVFGLPAVAARSVADHEWQVSLEHGNSFMGDERGGEVLLLDGESTELVLRHYRRLGVCWQAEAVLPFIAHTRGWADRAIEQWHDVFGLPNARRDDFAAFELRYAWQDAQGRLRELDEAVAGLGDVQLAVQRTVGCRQGARDPSRRPIARLGIKLPSGDPDKLLGSGAADLYVDLQSPVWRLTPRWRLGTTLGALVTGRSELVAAQHPLVLFGALGVELRLLPRWRTHVQLDWHTPFHDSALRELGEPAASLSFGLRYVAGAAGRFEFSIAEDALVDTVPDIVARLAWTWAPR